MNKKQKKVLKRILLAVLCIGVLHFLPVDGTFEIFIIHDSISDYRI